jgi:large conductance mechanosensitive channel
MLQEFKNFAFKGNVLDLAVATVIGAAFNAIVGAVVDNILMPIIGMITGGVDFNSLAFKVGDAELKYGVAISAVIKFLAIAIFLFIVVKAANKAQATKVEEVIEAGPTELDILKEIRDSLKK